jgi:hypothetical protein
MAASKSILPCVSLAKHNYHGWVCGVNPRNTKPHNLVTKAEYSNSIKSR